MRMNPPSELVNKLNWNKTCGEILKQHRKAHGFKQVDVASKIGISRYTYITIELGRQTATVDYNMFLRICDAINIKENEFYREFLKKSHENT